MSFISSADTTFILSLGEIVTPSLELMQKKLIEILLINHAEWKLEQARECIKSILPGLQSSINHFKLGLQSEADFDETICKAFSISSSQLNVVWDAMNPSYEQFKDKLEDAAKHKLVFISFSNPKDMRHLREQLLQNKVPIKLDGDGLLIEISGIPIYWTYAMKLSKDKLIEYVIQIVEEMVKIKPLTLFPQESKHAPKERNVCFIKGVNKITGELVESLSVNFDQTAQATAATATRLGAHAILWDKSVATYLSELLDRENKPIYVNFAKL